MKVNRMTAEEARKRLDDNVEVWSNRDETQLADVMDMIGHAINLKQSKLVYCLPLTNLVYAEIINLGYTISSNRDITHTAYNISW
jgi:hypothetical protein